MARWRPGARERLQQAALDLFSEQGFDQTTVSQIAERADLTTRTFFRYFTDKREVLFVGDQRAPAIVSEAITSAPAELSPVQVVEAAVRGISNLFDQDPEYLRKRRAVVAADPSLRERELRKLADMSDAAAQAFRERGLDPVGATLAAELAVTVVRVSIGRWLEDGNSAPDKDELSAIVLDTLQRLRQLSE